MNLASSRVAFDTHHPRNLKRSETNNNIPRMIPLPHALRDRVSGPLPTRPEALAFPLTMV